MASYKWNDHETVNGSSSVVRVREIPKYVVKEQDSNFRKSFFGISHKDAARYALSDL